jgi:hypothetical protein
LEEQTSQEEQKRPSVAKKANDESSDFSSDDSEGEEKKEKGVETEDESEPIQFVQRYSIDIIAEQKDYQNEPELVLHWAVARRSPAEWVKPDDSFLPANSKRFDAVCV